MSIKLMTAAWETSIPASDKMVLLCLCDHASDDGQCWPSVPRIAKKCSVSERTVQRSIKRLREWGLLTYEEESGRLHKFRINPRLGDTPDTVSPPTLTTEPPTQCHPTPDTVSPEPSITIIEPSEDSPPDGERPLSVSEIVEGWNHLAGECGLPRVGKLTQQRERQAKARLREYPEIEPWQSAFASIRGSPFLRGQNDRGWRADFDFLLQPKSFTKLVEGSYGQ